MRFGEKLGLCDFKNFVVDLNKPNLVPLRIFAALRET